MRLKPQKDLALLAQAELNPTPPVMAALFHYASIWDNIPYTPTGEELHQLGIAEQALREALKPAKVARADMASGTWGIHTGPETAIVTVPGT